MTAPITRLQLGLLLPLRSCKIPKYVNIATVDTGKMRKCRQTTLTVCRYDDNSKEINADKVVGAVNVRLRFAPTTNPSI